MRHVIIILIIGTFLTGCEKQNEELEEFAFDDSQIAYRDVHKYTFDENGRIQLDRKTSYQFMAGVAFDSTITETVFRYNEKGQLISAGDSPESTRQVIIYNDLDSLVGDFRINEFGDTTRLISNVYEDNRLVRTINRYLDMKLPENAAKIRKDDQRNYDTVLFVSDLVYENDIHIKSFSRDKAGIVSEEIEHFYEGGKLVRTITYAFLGDAKYIRQTTYYTAKDQSDADFVSIDTQGDTIAFTKTYKNNDGKVVVDYSKEFNVQDMWYYDINGKLLANAIIDENAAVKMVTKYSYDSRGNKIEQLTYRVRLDGSVDNGL
jgi:hypothetical protein